MLYEFETELIAVAPHNSASARGPLLLMVLGEQQGELGRQQGELGREQARLADIARGQIRVLIDDAIRRGLAQRVN